MRYLVTGGAGFIGSHLVEHLLAHQAECEVLTLDALTYAGHLDNLEGVAADPRHRFVQGDICDAATVEAVMDGVDVVYNLAAESHVDRSIAADAAFVRTNVVGTATLLGAARAAGVRRFVQVSTDEVYGELDWRDPSGDQRPEPPSRFTESTPLAPRSPYSATKAGADHLALAYAATHDMDVVITRSSNNYGPRQFPEKLIPVVITRALRHEPVPLYGDGLHVRDWIHVADHCAGLIATAERGVAGRVYNFGGDAERTNETLVRAILRILGKSEELISPVPDRPGHDRRYAVDFGRATAELSWAPATAFGEGLERTVAWYVDNADWVGAVMTAAAARPRG